MLLIALLLLRGRADPKDLAKIKPPHSSGRSLDHPEHLTDDDKDTYATQLSKGKHFLQWNYRGTYELSTFAFRLEEGVTYKSFEILISDQPTSGFKSVHKESNFKQSADVKWVFFVPTVKASHIRFVVDPGDGKETKFNLVQIWGVGDYYEGPTKYDGTRNNTKYTKLIWTDFFDGDELDTTKWHIIENMTWAYYIHNHRAIRIMKDGDNSYLALKCKNFGTYEKLTAELGPPDLRPGQKIKKEQLTWMCGRVKSRGIFQFTHGRVAIRAKCDGTRGHWPALWMYPDTERLNDEIDILESPHSSYEFSYMVHTTNHFGRTHIDKGSDTKHTASYEALAEGFHVYEVEWDLQSIRFFFDGEQIFETSKGKNVDGMHSIPFYLIMEAQMAKDDGGGWSGPPIPGETDEDTEFLIDWVKVYQTDVHNRTYTDSMLTLSPTTPTNPYVISPCKTSGEDHFVSFWHGTEPWHDYHNFYGEIEIPLPTRKRVSVAQGHDDEYLVWHVDGVTHAFFTVYYATVDGVTSHSPDGTKCGVPITDRLLNGAKLDFKLYVSATGEDGTWKEHKMRFFQNFVNLYPQFSQVNLETYDIPDGMNYAKLQFPKISGVQYKDKNSKGVAVVNTDVQLSKAVFTKVSSGSD